jgi:SAM-dependent methyltransferase
MQITGERQVAPTLGGIRLDHVARYRWAARTLPARSRVVDFACGIGYGTQILAEAGHDANGYDKAADAIAYGSKFYPAGRLRLADGECPLRAFDAAVCFETIEHVEDPRPLLRSLARGKLLLASVPNEDVMPYGDGFAFHYRHYTRGEFEELLNECGWTVREWWGQKGPESEVERDLNGRTIIAVAERAEQPMRDDTKRADIVEVKEPVVPAVDDDLGVPEHVTILGLGPSLEQYVDIAKRLGGKHAYCDEVWGINAVAGVVMCDRVFHMDDVRVQEARAKAQPESNIARMLEWIKVHPGPIVTSRAHPDYPGLVEFPLEDVLNKFQHAYFNSTAAYAIAYALFLGVKKLSLFGMDYTYPNAHQAEKGRACVEFWLGLATERGVKIMIPKTSTLMDALHTQEERLYGYDTLDVTIRTEGQRICVDLVEKATPTADEMEARYDHTAHPNALVKAS